MSKVLAAFGLVLVAASLVFGLTPVHTGGMSCGSVIEADNSAVAGAKIYNRLLDAGGSVLPRKPIPDCDGARSGRLPIVAVFGVAGLGCLIGAVVTAIGRRATPAT